ncbi:MAG: phosphatase PAP2 family protein [Nitratireductor sp.]
MVSALARPVAHILPGTALAERSASQRRQTLACWNSDRRWGPLALVRYITRLAVFLLCQIDCIDCPLRRLRVIGAACADDPPVSLNEGNIVPFIWRDRGSNPDRLASIVLQLFFDQEFVRSDEAISAYLQTLRTPLADQFMIGVTMLGDGLVLAPVAIALIGVIAWHRRWKLAGTVALAFAGASVFVPVMKMLIHRTRPMELYQGADGFSFPSGHATLSAAIVGITVLVCAHELKLRARLTAFAIGAGLIVMIAFSRLYLRAHWPSDVFAGVLFGISLTFLLAWLIHGRQLAPVSRRAAMLVGAVLLTAYPLHLFNGYGSAQEKYVRAVEERTITMAEWLADPLQFGPANRIMLDGEMAQRTILQTDITISLIKKTLERSGWKKSEARQLTQIVNAILPSQSGSGTFVPFPETNNGALPVATFFREKAPSEHEVLRFWATGYKVVTASKSSDLLVATVSGQSSDPIGLSFSLPDHLVIDAQESSAVAEIIASKLSLGGNVPVQSNGTFILPSTCTHAEECYEPSYSQNR